jgi:hypothetical protein
MIHRRFLQWLFLILALCGSPAIHAQALAQFINGSTCDYNPSPGVFTAVTGAFIAGSDTTVYCAITAPAAPLTGPSPTLATVLYMGQNLGPGAFVRARLCQFNSTATQVVVQCSAAKESRLTRFIEFLLPPGGLGSAPTGSYVQFTFGGPAVSAVHQLQAFWQP